MKSWQKTIKYLAMAFAVFLIVSIFGGIFASLGAFNIVGSLFDKKTDVLLGELKTYTVSDRVADIEIDVAAAEFTVMQADSFYVESNIENITVKVNNGCLKIDDNVESGASLLSADTAVLNVYIPAGYVFGVADIDTGAGRVVINELSANELELDLGAGEAEMKNITVTDKTEISGGTGNVNITDCKFYKPELSLGVGEFSFTGELLGKGSIDMGIGEANIILLGDKNDYTVSVTKGVGEANVDGYRVDNNEVFGNGENRIDISGGIGEVNVEFN
ncbi:MAG: DUF4097 family beta strand repeat protein [Clostridia bacterium]|nr:DUF4097 family beta strand repeat protein [Clostridia bacterium]